MDATPVTLGQEFGGYAAPDRATASSGCRPRCPASAELPLGGTAVGTGINTPPGFAAAVIAQLADADRPAADRGPQPLRGPGRPRRAGRGLRRAADDRRQPDQDLQRPALDGLRARAPASARSHLPDLQPGSLDHARQGEPGAPRGRLPGRAPRSSATTPPSPSAGAAGNFELNVMLPVMARNLLESIRLLANVAAAARRPLRRRHRGQRRALPRAAPSPRRRSSRR